MKKITFLFVLSLSITAFSQCPFNNTFYINLTPASEGGTASDACVFGGDLVTSNVVFGETYVVSLCNNTGFEDSQLTLYDSTGTMVLGYSDDFCGVYSEITWVANYTGILNIIVDEFPCLTGNACMNLDVTWQNNLSNESFSSSSISIYPNPVNDVVNFNNLKNEKYNVSLYDINGRLLIYKEINENFDILDVSSLNSGVYQLEIINGEEKTNKKLIKN
ncbi:Por secretion system C-terminal sorting domain-containing protein [Flavobacterium swingsii]|jgi:hypothetical protein|uniref:Por secretion system C-terminal sorting domain-containing protein n=1 Tax=Flavobacterium swingsii TaxID=498292 RepID=A0A1I0YHN2_9FLAO|nr:T9SS type A sorting domain-containing protein [Flavobacterium swingsii]SFB12256.1 Por secretion system C-terminal sorting domain-containing protein [Flavobacterium swingsii]